VALHFAKVGRSLVDPSKYSQDDRVILDPIDQDDGGRLLQHTVHLLHCVQRYRQRAGYVGLDPDSYLEIEPTLRRVCVVDDLGLVDDRIGDPHLIAIPGGDNRRARVQRGNAAFDPFDDDGVVRREWPAQAQQYAGYVVLQGVAHRETDRQAQHTGGAENRPDKRRGPENVHRQDQAHQDEDYPDDLLQQVFHELVADHAPEDVGPPGKKNSRDPERGPDE